MLFSKKTKNTEPINVLSTLKEILDYRENNQLQAILNGRKLDFIHISNSSKYLELDLKDYDNLHVITEYEASIKKYAHKKGSYIHYISNNGRLVVITIKNGQHTLHIVK